MNGFDHDRATQTLDWLKTRTPDDPSVPDAHRWETAQNAYVATGRGDNQDFEEDMNCLMDRGQLYEPVLGVLKVA